MSHSHVNIIFDGPPGPESGRFIESETDSGEGVNTGEWIERLDGTWALRIAVPSEAKIRRDALRQVREVVTGLAADAQHGYISPAIAFYGILNVLTRLEQETPAEPEKETGCSLPESASSSSEPTPPLGLLSGQQNYPMSGVSASAALQRSPSPLALSSASSASAGPPLPPEGMHLKPLADGHVVQDDERTRNFGNTQWLLSARRGLVADPSCWYAAPDPPDWPKLLPGTRRLNAWDEPMDGDLHCYPTEDGWKARSPEFPFASSDLEQGRYSRPLPQPEPAAEILDQARGHVREALRLHPKTTQSPAEERESKDRPDKALTPSSSQYAETTYLVNHARHIDDHAARLDRIEAQADRIIQYLGGFRSSQAYGGDRESVVANLRTGQEADRG